MELETINKLYLELSQVATAKTKRELELEKTVACFNSRKQELEDLLRSACAIADRKGEGTHWERFIASANQLGLNGVTPRTYRLLPSDPALPGPKIRTQEDRDDDKFDAEMS